MRIHTLWGKKLKPKSYLGVNTRQVLTVYDLNQDKSVLLTLYKGK